MTEALRSDVDPHFLLERDAAAIAPGAEGIVFLPYLMGERGPIWDAKASGAFVGLSLYHRRAHLYRAVLEGVAFALKHNIDAGACGAQFLDERLVVVGGASHSNLWMQIIADVTGYPVYTIDDNVEAALGAALLAAFGVGLIDTSQVEKGWARLRLRTTPDIAASRRYQHIFAQYRGLYPSLKSAMHQLHAC